MLYLALVSCLWAFSFGLIGSALSGLDSQVVATLRLGIALLLFLPFLRWRSLQWRDGITLCLIGAVQFGVMYLTYLQAFRFIPSHLVALFSILTPVYVILIHDLMVRRFHWSYLAVAFLSVLGAGVIRYESGNQGAFWIGFGLMQVAGVAFAFGQVAYRKWKQQHPETPHHESFALLYLGGFSLAAIATLSMTGMELPEIDGEQWQAILYLGAVASGLGFFFWNKGASQTSPSTLAVFNNAVVPLGVFCSLFVFGEKDDLQVEELVRLAIGAALIGAAVFLANRLQPKSA